MVYNFRAEELIREFVLRWYSQGGTDYMSLDSEMEKDYEFLLAEMGKEIDKIYMEWHTRAFDLISKYHG